jgi:DNA replication and repair protein RecF
MRLAEALDLRDASGEQPVLLLDDVLSELDEHRRASVLDAIDADQMLITSPDPDRFAALIAVGAQRWDVRAGSAVKCS